jgi:hypothetical protein
MMRFYREILVRLELLRGEVTSIKLNPNRGTTDQREFWLIIIIRMAMTGNRDKFSSETNLPPINPFSHGE